MTTKEKIMALVECQPGCTAAEIAAEIAAAIPEVSQRCIDTEVSSLKRRGKIRADGKVKVHRGWAHRLYPAKPVEPSVAEILKLAKERLPAMPQKGVTLAPTFDDLCVLPQELTINGERYVVASRLVEAERLLAQAEAAKQQAEENLAALQAANDGHLAQVKSLNHRKITGGEVMELVLGFNEDLFTALGAGDTIKIIRKGEKV